MQEEDVGIRIRSQRATARSADGHDRQAAALEPDATDLVAYGARQVSTIYTLLRRKGVSQRQIAAMTGQSQSEVSEILKGRQVMAYDVLVRIADGLGVPRGYMGLAHDEGGPPAHPLHEAEFVRALPRLVPAEGRARVRAPAAAEARV